MYAAHVPPAVPSPAPALSALTPHQLATRLSLTTPRPGPELGNTRDYTVFDMLWSLSPRLPKTLWTRAPTRGLATTAHAS